MYCKKCGKQISDNSTFCSNCGAQMQSYETKSKKVNMKAVISVVVVAFVLISIISFIASSVITDDKMLLQGVEFGMSKSQVVSKVKLDNIYNEDNQYIAYASYNALKIGELDIPAEVQFIFNGSNQLCEIDYEFEGGSDENTDVVSDYLNKKYSGEDMQCVGHNLSGRKENDDYYIEGDGDRICIISKKYTNDDN